MFCTLCIGQSAACSLLLESSINYMQAQSPTQQTTSTTTIATPRDATHYNDFRHRASLQAKGMCRHVTADSLRGCGPQICPWLDPLSPPVLPPAAAAAPPSDRALAVAVVTLVAVAAAASETAPTALLNRVLACTRPPLNPADTLPVKL